jgi:hypothetical protein
MSVNEGRGHYLEDVKIMAGSVRNQVDLCGRIRQMELLDCSCMVET